MNIRIIFEVLGFVAVLFLSGFGTAWLLYMLMQREGKPKKDLIIPPSRLSEEVNDLAKDRYPVIRD